MTAFDVVVVVVLVCSALLSLLRGATREILTLLAWIGAVATAYFGFGPAQELAQKTIETWWIAGAVSFFAVFVVPLVAFKLIAASLADHLPGGPLAKVDRVAGVAFGIARGGLLVCVGYLGLAALISPDNHPPWVKDAALLPYVQEGAEWLRGLIPENLEATAAVVPR